MRFLEFGIWCVFVEGKLFHLQCTETDSWFILTCIYTKCRQIYTSLEKNVYLEPKRPVFWMESKPQNRGQTGSRYIYIYLPTVGWSYRCCSRWFPTVRPSWFASWGWSKGGEPNRWENEDSWVGMNGPTWGVRWYSHILLDTMFFLNCLYINMFLIMYICIYLYIYLYVTDKAPDAQYYEKERIHIYVVDGWSLVTHEYSIWPTPRWTMPV